MQHVRRIAALSWRVKLVGMGVIVVGLVTAIIYPAFAITDTVLPDSTVSNDWTDSTGCNTDPAACINDNGGTDTADYIGTGTSLQDVSATFTMSSPSNVGAATQVTLYVYARSMGSNGSRFDSIDMNATIGGQTLAIDNNILTNGWAWYSTTYTGTWSQSDIDDIQATFTRIVRGTSSAGANDDNVRIASVYAEVTYTTPVQTTQAAYRFYQNVNNGSASYTAPTVRSVSTSNTNPVTKPAGTAAGDTIVLVYAADTGNMSAMTFPSGFSEISATTNGNAAGHLKIAIKTATGSEPATYSVGMPADASVRLDAITIQNADTSISPVAAATQTASSSTSHTAPSVTPTGPNDLLLSVASINTGSSVGSASWTAPSGMTELTDALSDGWLTSTVAAQSLSSNAATGTRTFGLTSPRSDPAITASVTFQGVGLLTGPDDGTPLGARDTAVAVSASETPFRLRLNLGVSAADAAIGTGVYKLQYARRGADNSCDTSFTNESYADVSATSAVKFYDNSSAIDGATMSSSANDPTRSGVTAIGQTYEEAGGFHNTVMIPAGQDGIWDFSLALDASAPAGQYCLRAVRSGGAILNTYSVMPEVGVQSTVDQASYRFYNNDATAPSSSYTTPAVRSFSTSLTKTVTQPSNVVTGDLLVLVYAADDGNLSAMTLPSGFTEVSATTNGADLGHLKIATKIAGGSEPASYTVGATSGASVRVDLFAIQDADTNLSPVVVAAQTSSSSTSHVAPSVSATGPNDLLLSIASVQYDANLPSVSWTPPSGMTEMTDSTDGWITTTVARQSLSGSGATGTRAFSLANSPSMIGITASLSVQGIGTLIPISIGAPLATQDTVAVGPVAGTPFRLRLNLGVANAAVAGDSFKLQYATKIGGNCSFGSYADITTGSPIKFYDNSTITDGYAYGASVNDPTRAGITAVGQSYKESNPFTAIQTIPSGQDGLWDFALTFDATAPAADRYCLRAVTSAGVALSAYTQTAEIVVPGTAVATLSQQLRGGQSVVEGDKRRFIW